MVTRADVAKAARVSPSSVSYYINKSGYVSKESAERIKKAIKDLNYRPNLLAKSLKNNENKQIVYICNEIRNPFHANIAHSLSKEALERGFQTIFCNYNGDKNNDEAILTACSYMVAGVFVAFVNLSVETVNQISDMNIPVILLGNRFRNTRADEVNIIEINHQKAMDDMLQQCEKTQKKTIAYLSGMVLNDQKNRKIEFLRASLEKTSMIFDEEFSIDCSFVGNDDTTKLYQYFKNQKNFPDVLLCSNDNIALGVLSVAKDLGIKIPDDLAVVGMDNTVYGALSRPQLSSINTKPDIIGQTALNLLLEDEKPYGKKIELFSEFTKRESC